MKKLLLLMLMILTVNVMAQSQTAIDAPSDIYISQEQGTTEWIGYVTPTTDGSEVWIKDDNQQLQLAAKALNYGDGQIRIIVSPPTASPYKRIYYGNTELKYYYASGQSNYIICNPNVPKYRILEKTSGLNNSVSKLLRQYGF